MAHSLNTQRTDGFHTAAHSVVLMIRVAQVDVLLITITQRCFYEGIISYDFFFFF